MGCVCISVAKGTSYSQEHPGQGLNDARRSAEFFKKYQVLGKELDICILIFNKWLTVFTLFLGPRASGLSPRPVSRTVWTESISSLPKNKHRGQGPLLWHTEGARTLGSISGSTSYYLAGLGQVTVFVPWLSRLSNDDLIPTPPWAVGRFHCIEHPAQCLAFFWLCSVLFILCWA